MPELERVRIEVERIVNLITAIGWTKIEERIDEDSVVIVIKKKLTPITEG